MIFLMFVVSFVLVWTTFFSVTQLNKFPSFVIAVIKTGKISVSTFRSGCQSRSTGESGRATAFSFGAPSAAGKVPWPRFGGAAPLQNGWCPIMAGRGAIVAAPPRDTWRVPVGWVHACARSQHRCGASETDGLLPPREWVSAVRVCVMLFARDQYCAGI
jgi:hypothetical protein